jgi:hypothetical protein
LMAFACFGAGIKAGLHDGAQSRPGTREAALHHLHDFS